MDWNNDGKLDIVAGDTNGEVWFFLNQGSPEQPVLAAGQRVASDGRTISGRQGRMAVRIARSGTASTRAAAMGTYSKLHVADFDGDGLKDLLIGQTCSEGENIVFYRNAGTAAEPKFGKPKVVDLPEPAMRRPSPYLVDWDGDGKLDLLCGTEGAQVVYFHNVGTAQEPKWELGRPLVLEGKGFDKSYRARIAVVDWNEDGVLDLLVGNRTKTGGNVWLFLGK